MYVGDKKAGRGVGPHLHSREGAKGRRVGCFRVVFHGHTKGPGIFWEKDWGKINSESYCAHTVPVIYGYIELMRREGVDTQLGTSVL